MSDDARTMMHAPHRRARAPIKHKHRKKPERIGHSTYIKWRGGRHRAVVVEGGAMNNYIHRGAIMIGVQLHAQRFVCVLHVLFSHSHLRGRWSAGDRASSTNAACTDTHLRANAKRWVLASWTQE